MKTEILTLINQKYPLSIGAILTGSYLSKDYSTSSSDIDIIVFDPSFSHISPQGYMFEGKRIDFTQVPLYNLDNMLRNEQFDQRGILLTMISKGNIIKDNDRLIIQKIKTKASYLFNQGIYDNLEKYKALNKGLQKIRKDFDKILPSELRFFLINEFFFLVTEMQLIKNCNWRMSGKHKGQLLMQHAPEFMKDLILLTNNAIQDSSENSFKKIGQFADDLIETSGYFPIEKILDEKYLIIDLDYEELSIESFIFAVLPKLKENSVLSEFYQHFSISNIVLHRVFKNKISIYFHDSKSLKAVKANLLSEFNRIISNVVGSNYRYTLLASYEANEINCNNIFYENFIDVIKEISIMNEQIISDYGCYDVNRQLMISTIIDSFLISYLNIKKDEALKILYYLASRFILNRHEQRQNTPETIATLKRKKFLSFNAHYQEYRDIMMQATEKGSSIANDSELSKGKVYYNVISNLKIAIEKIEPNLTKLLEENALTIDVINTSLENISPEVTIKFILIFQYLRPKLLLNSDQVALGLTILASAKSELD